MLRDTVVQVNLSVLAKNMDMICEMSGNQVAVMPVIKANGYGHGTVGIAPTLMEHGAAYLGVATLTEALELRQVYADYPIFILGHTPDRLLPLVVENNITQTIFSKQQAQILAAEGLRLNRTPKVHIKVDTGFHRLGIDDLTELTAICNTKGLEVEGIFSHLALVNDQENKNQYDKFQSIIGQLEAAGFAFKYKHIADSISAVDFPEYRMNMIRPGALVFGLRGFHKGFLGVEQALSFVSRISQIHEVEAGEGVGYDYLWKAPKHTRIGTVPFGYADGYPRNLRDKGYVTVHGVKCPVIGVICMDQCMIDLSNAPQAQEGDLVVIYGNGQNNTMSVDEAAKLASTNKNEIVARITARPPREYIK